MDDTYTYRFLDTCAALYMLTEGGESTEVRTSPNVTERPPGPRGLLVVVEPATVPWGVNMKGPLASQTASSGSSVSPPKRY
jgi:hypothetical protein